MTTGGDIFHTHIWHWFFPAELTCDYAISEILLLHLIQKNALVDSFTNPSHLLASYRRRGFASRGHQRYDFRDLVDLLWRLKRKSNEGIEFLRSWNRSFVIAICFIVYILSMRVCSSSFRYLFRWWDFVRHHSGISFDDEILFVIIISFFLFNDDIWVANLCLEDR